MRVSRDEMDKSHGRIVEGAARLVRQRGIEGTSVADVMGEAGLTQGGFYRHFKTKHDLISAALDWAFGQMTGVLNRYFETLSPKAAVAAYHALYLSQEHLTASDFRCPVAALAGDVARSSDALKVAFGEGVNRTVALLARGMEGSAARKRAKAIRELALLTGAVAIARASDPDTARQVLEACRVEAEPG